MSVEDLENAERLHVIGRLFQVRYLLSRAKRADPDADSGIGATNKKGWRRPNFDRHRSDSTPTAGSEIASKNPMAP